MKAFETIKKYDMLTGAKQVLCALSGGQDSVALTHFMAKNASVLGIKVCAAHFSHGIRPEAAEFEKKLCEDLCKELKIDLFCGKGDVPAYAKEKGMGTELAARELRYDFLYKTAEQAGGALIATAHHLTDNAETVIMNLIRGTSVKGLCGIPPVRDGIIRPFIETSKDEIEKYIKDNRLFYATDQTNFEPCCRRNALRLNVLPGLSELEPAAVRNIGRMSNRAREILREAEKEAEKALSLCVFTPQSVYINASLPLSLRSDSRAVLFDMLYKKAGGKSMLSEKHINALTQLCKSADPSASAYLPQIQVKREYEKLVFSAQINVEKPQETEIFSGESVIFGEYLIKAESGITEKSFTFDKNLVKAPLIVRSRREGDVIFINGMNKSLKKLMIEKRIPKEKRDITPVLCDNNKVIAVAEIGMDMRLLPTDAENAFSVKLERRKV